MLCDASAFRVSNDNPAGRTRRDGHVLHYMCIHAGKHAQHQKGRSKCVRCSRGEKRPSDAKGEAMGPNKTFVGQDLPCVFHITRICVGSPVTAKCTCNAGAARHEILTRGATRADPKQTCPPGGGCNCRSKTAARRLACSRNAAVSRTDVWSKKQRPSPCDSGGRCSFAGMAAKVCFAAGACSHVAKPAVPKFVWQGSPIHL